MAAKLQSTAPPTSTFAPSASGPISSGRAPATRKSSKPFDIGSNPPPTGPVSHATHQSRSSQQSNPFRTPTHTPHVSESSQSAFSPVSPIGPTDIDSRFRQHQQGRPQVKFAPQKHGASSKMASEPRKSVDLRKLDGKPYPGHEDDAEPKPRKVKVARDMYAGDLPPMYEQKDYQGPVAGKGACHKCGGHKKSDSDGHVGPESTQPQSQMTGHGCHKCGGKSTPPSSFPHGAMANAQPRAGRSAPVPSSSEAGPSGHRHKCDKCGRKKRPDSISSTGSQQPRSPQAGASFQPSIPQIQTNGVPIMNIEPPTAITERAPTMPFSPASTIGETPLIKHENQAAASRKKGHQPARSGSFSSLFRSLSRRKKTSDGPLPSQQLSQTTPHNIVDKISHALGESQDASNSNYARLKPEDQIVRPGSPFSFIDKPREEQAFEMNDMRKSKVMEGASVARRDSWDKADESTNFLADESAAARPRYSRSQSTRHHLRSQTEDGDVYLALPPDQRPGVTRFKSLRQGVDRAANGLSRSASQISRSTSLRRLGSVKKVPELYYRSDMNEYDQFAY